MNQNPTGSEGIDLAPCPFCGEAAAEFYEDTSADDRHLWAHDVECNNCGASTKWTNTRANAAADWNRRATLPSEADERDFDAWLAADKIYHRTVIDRLRAAWNAALNHRATTATAGYKLVPIEPHIGPNYEAGLWSRRNWEAALEDQAAAPDTATTADELRTTLQELASTQRKLIDANAELAVYQMGATTAEQQTERKAQQVGMPRTGYILQDDTGRACIVHQGAVRWLSNAELWEIVHPAATTASASIDTPEFRQRLHSARMAVSEAEQRAADRDLIAYIDSRATAPSRDADQGAAQAQTGDVARDAARYRWLRNCPPGSDQAYICLSCEAEEMDEAIDEALAAMSAPATSKEKP